MKDNNFENKNLKFIWGIKSSMDLTEIEPCLYTMNDIDICYDKKNKCYLLGIGTNLIFKNTKEEYNYLKELLDKFGDYIQKKYRIFELPKYNFFFKDITNTCFESEQECYAWFDIFVRGFAEQNIDSIKEVTKVPLYRTKIKNQKVELPLDLMKEFGIKNGNKVCLWYDKNSNSIKIGRE